MCGADVITSPEMPAADDAGCPYVITFIMQLWKFSLPGPSPPLLLFLPCPKLSVAHSEGHGVRSLGQLGAQGQLQRNPIPGFPHPSSLSEGAEGVDGWEKALLHLVEWKGITLEPGFPHPWHLQRLGPGANCSILLLWRSNPSPKWAGGC